MTNHLQHCIGVTRSKRPKLIFLLLRKVAGTDSPLLKIPHYAYTKPLLVIFTANQHNSSGLQATYSKSSNFPFKKSSTRSIRFRKSGVDHFLSLGSLTSFSLNNISPSPVSNQLAYCAF